MHKTLTGIGMIGLIAGHSVAGTVDASGVLNDNTALVDGYQDLVGAGVPTRVNHVDGLTGSTMNFTGVTGFDNSNFDVTASSSGSFFLGDSASLGDNWFNAGTNSRPDDGTITLAFGQSSGAISANDVTLSFAPGVTAFGFNYDDIDSTQIVITFADDDNDPTNDLVSETLSDSEGFVSIVAGTNQTILSITLTQSGSGNDGITFYGFQTVQAVPLPPAALAGLGLLGGMGIARRLRKS